MTELEKVVFAITRPFVEEVKKRMLDKYLLLRSEDRKSYLINTLLEKYRNETVKADKDEQQSFERYLKGDPNVMLEVTCLNHAKHYKQIIIDLLQE